MPQKFSRVVRLICLLPWKNSALRLWNRLERLRGRHEVQTYFGARMFCDATDIIQATIIHFGVWEPHISGILETLIRPGDLAVDVGANIGYHSLLLASLGAEVVSIEAHPRLAEEIRQNAQRNGLRVQVENVAVTHSVGTVNLYEAPRLNSGSNTLKSDQFEKSIRVKAARLLDVISEPGRVSILKCDIEGAEGPVIAELAANIDRFTALRAMILEIDRNVDWSEAFDVFQNCGFTAYVISVPIADAWKAMLEGKHAERRDKLNSPYSGGEILLVRDIPPHQ